MKIIQHFPYSVTLPEIIDRQCAARESKLAPRSKKNIYYPHPHPRLVPTTHDPRPTTIRQTRAPAVLLTKRPFSSNVFGNKRQQSFEKLTKGLT